MLPLPYFICVFTVELFDYIIQCEYFTILYKKTQKIQNSGGRVMFPKWRENTLHGVSSLPEVMSCDKKNTLPNKRHKKKTTNVAGLHLLFECNKTMFSHGKAHFVIHMGEIVLQQRSPKVTCTRLVQKLLRQSPFCQTD